MLKYRQVACVMVISLLLLSVPLLAQDYVVPRDEFGYPNLNGVWNFNDSTPFERPTRFGDRENLNQEELAAKFNRLASSQARRSQREQDVAQRVLEVPTDDTGAYNTFWSYYDEPFPNTRTSMIIYPSDGRIPTTQNGVITQRSPPPSNPCNEGLVVIADRPSRISFGAISCDRPEDFGLASRCLLFPQTTGPYIKANSYNNNVQIVVTRNYVMLYTELGNDPRIVRLDNSPFLDQRIATWTGSSRGRWEGDSLVVETRHFNPNMASIFMRAVAFGSAAEMVLTERFTRVGDGALEYEFTVDDPATFTEQIVGVTHFSRLDAPIYEFACHEGNYALLNMLRGARLEELRAEGYDQ
ncbi:MAG: hypothetical protein L7S70_05905 [Pseudomonadales bacterium]|jgi:hypothetical protein|nr:hypothetical protein [Pseudomonadales bacterium]